MFSMRLYRFSRQRRYFTITSLDANESSRLTFRWRAREIAINEKLGAFLLPVENPVTATPASLSLVVALSGANFSARTDYRVHIVVSSTRLKSHRAIVTRIKVRDHRCHVQMMSFQQLCSPILSEGTARVVLRFTREMYACMRVCTRVCTYLQFRLI